MLAEQLASRWMWSFKARGVGLTVLGLGLVLTWLTVHRDRQAANDRIAFRRQVASTRVQETVRGAIADRMKRFGQALRGGQGLFAASKSVERSEWKEYVDALKRSVDFTGVDAMMVITRVTDENREGFLEYTRSDARPDFAIMAIPAELRDPPDEDWIVTHCEPLEHAEGVIGWDLRGWENRKEALEGARDRDEAVITRHLGVLPGSGADGLIMFVPIYTNGKPHATVEERRVNLWGWIGCRLRTNEFLSTGVLKGLAIQADIHIYDGGWTAGTALGEVESYEHLLYDGHKSVSRGHQNDAETNETNTARFTLPIAGRTWKIQVAMYDYAEQAVFPLGLLIGGIFASLAAAGCTVAVARTRDRAMMLAKGMTTDLRAAVASTEEANREVMFQKTALDHANIVSETDANGRITYVNDNFCKISGYSRENLIGQNHQILNSGQHSKEFWKGMFASLVKHGIWQGTICNRDKNGNLYWVRSTMVAFRIGRGMEHGEGRITRYVSIRTDITEQMRAETELAATLEQVQEHARQVAIAMKATEASEERARMIVASALDAAVATDDTGTIIGWNPQAEAIFGWSSAEALGKNLMKTMISSRYREAHRTGMARFLDTNMGTVLGKRRELAAIRSSGEEFPIEMAISGVRTSEGRMMFSAFIRDITERKQFEKDLVEAKAMAENANQAKSEFLATMSHEIRTPLNGVVGTLELLEGTTLNELQHRYLKIGRNSAVSLLSVINDILDFSKIEAGKMELSFDDFDLYDVIEDVMEALAVRASEKRLEMVCCIDPSLPRMIRGDADRLRQIIVNLANNAIKFTEQGTVTLRVVPMACSHETGALRMRISVIDTGIGIEEDRLDRLFKAFSQADASTTRKFGGTGLGLAISKQLAELMGGSIGVQSESGQGSTFWVEIEVRYAEESESVSQTTSHVELEGARVLVIDDAPVQLEMIANSLEYFGIEVETACSGEAGLEKMLQAANNGKPFEVVLLDYRMPGLDGAEVASVMQSVPPLSNIPRVMISSAMDLDPEVIQMLGFASRLVKPIRQSELIDAVVCAMSLPVQANQTAGSEPAIDRAKVAARVPDPSTPLPSTSSLRVLIAEDNEINQIISCELLTSSGYECEVAPNGRAAVEAVSESAFDLVLMDCQMPEMDGFAATREIRRLEEAGELTVQADRRLPIIALTANAIKGDRERCLQAGMDAYTTKPIDMKHLKATIDDLLSSRSSERNAA